jgi:hypothetical protein
MTTQSLLEKVADAIATAQGVRAYGLYDYSSYPGDEPPYVIKYELAKPGETYEIARYTDEAQAKEHFERLRRDYVARAALAAVNQWLADDLIERMRRMGMR